MTKKKSHFSLDTMHNMCLICSEIIKMIDLKSHGNSNLVSINPIEVVSVRNGSHGRWRHCYVEIRIEYVLVVKISRQFRIIISLKGYTIK